MTVKHNVVKFKHFCVNFALIFSILFVLQKKNILVYAFMKIFLIRPSKNFLSKLLSLNSKLFSVLFDQIESIKNFNDSRQ